MIYTILVIVVVLAIVAIFIDTNRKYYHKVFDRSHYHEIANWLIEVLGKGEIEQPSVDNGTALMTRAGILIGYTRSCDDGDSLHFSISQINRSTTHAVGGRIIFLFLTLLDRNHCNAHFFYTQSTVHHLVLERSDIAEWQVNSIERAISAMDSYQPLPLQLEHV
jgi:hypothetical protein